MSTAELVFERVKALPEPLAREVLDFVSCLATRSDGALPDDLRAAQSIVLTAVWDNAEDEIWNDL